MTEETSTLSPSSEHEETGEGSNITKPSARPLNKRSKKSQNAGNAIKKVKTLDKTDKFKSWV